jgi:hypothetical protein
VSSSPLLLSPELPEVPAPFVFSSPKLFQIESNNFTLHGFTYFPPNFDVNKRYPLVVYTYGGPSVQLVTNEYIHVRGVRSSRLQLLASLGSLVSCFSFLSLSSCHVSSYHYLLVVTLYFIFVLLCCNTYLCSCLSDIFVISSFILPNRFCFVL